MKQSKPYETQLDFTKMRRDFIKKTVEDYKKGKITFDFLLFINFIKDFFCDCHHVKDYIINDKSLSIDSKTIDDYIGKNDCLKICADICNGEKHLVLKKGGWTGSIPVFHMNFQNSEKESEILIEFRSTIGDCEFFDLAGKCIAAWEKFIEQHLGETSKTIEPRIIKED